MIKAFSLIELMVVIAIVAILSGIAIPAYKQHVIKTKVVDGYQSLNVLVERGKEQYERTGSFPTSYLWHNGQTAPTGQWTTVNSFNFSQLGLTKSTDGKAAIIQGNMNNTGLASSIISIAVRDINGILVYKCGYWDSSSTSEFAAQYQPAQCTCTGIYAFAFSGTNC